MTEDPTRPSAADDRARRFAAALPAPPDRSRTETTWVRLGATLMVVGALLAVVAVALSQGSDNPLDQSTQLTLAVAGLALTCLGGVLFLRYSFGRMLRFWLLRMLDEQRRSDDRS